MMPSEGGTMHSEGRILHPEGGVIGSEGGMFFKSAKMLLVLATVFWWPLKKYLATFGAGKLSGAEMPEGAVF